MHLNPVKLVSIGLVQIRKITFFICHETTYDHVTKVCVVVHYHKPPPCHVLVAMSLVEMEINLFYFSSDSCVMGPLSDDHLS